MMLTTSVAAASMSDSFSYKLMHITPTKGVNRHSPVAGFIIAHRFVTGKHKTEQTIAAPFLCVIPNQKLYVPYGHVRSIRADTLIMDLRLSHTSQAEEHLRNAMRELAPGLPETYPFALR